MNVLVDTSVWSEALRRSKKIESDVVEEFRDLILESRIEIISPVRQELLSGIREQSQFKKLQKHLDAFPDLALKTDDFVTAAKFFSICRAKGIQGSNTDFLICAVASRRQLSIFTTDQDFSLYAKHLPVMLHVSRKSESRGKRAI